MKRAKIAIALLLGHLFIMACNSEPQPTIMDLLIHFEKQGIDVDTNPATAQEKEAFKKTLERLKALEKKFPRLATRKRERAYEEMKVVALDGLRVMIYRYKNKNKARQAYEMLVAKEKKEKKKEEKNERHLPFSPLRYSYLQHGAFLLKIPHWQPRVTGGRLSLFPPSVTEIEPDPAKVEKIQRVLASFPDRR